MSPKRRVLATLKKADLLAVDRAFDLDVTAQMTFGDLMDTIAGSKRATLDAILPTLSLGNLKAICQALDLPTTICHHGQRQAGAGRAHRDRL